MRRKVKSLPRDRFPVGVACRLGMVLGVWLFIATASEGAIIRFHNRVTVDRALVRLGDIAEIYDDDTALVGRLKNVTLEPAPEPGLQLRLSLDQVTDRLRAHGVDLSQAELRGRTSIIVTRSASSSQTNVENSSGTEVNSNPPVVRTIADRPEQQLRTAEIRQAEAHVETLIQQYLAEHAPEWGRPHIAVQLPSSQIPRLLQIDPDHLAIKAGTKLRDEHFQLILGTAGEQSELGDVTLTARIVRRPRALAARRDIARGDILTAADLQWQEIDGVRKEITAIENAVGKEARRSLLAGTFLKADDLADVPFVKRGDIVKVAASATGLRVVREFRAKKNGMRGEVIPLEAIDGRDTVSARVTALREAEIVEAASASGSVERSGLRVVPGSRAADSLESSHSVPPISSHKSVFQPSAVSVDSSLRARRE